MAEPNGTDVVVFVTTRGTSWKMFVIHDDQSLTTKTYQSSIFL
jgi:hypothetical protein